MSIVASDIYEFLEGYGITNIQLSPTWLQNRLNNFIIPFVQRITGMSFSGEENITEYLSKKNATTLVSIAYVQGGDILSEIGLGGVQLVEGGIIKAVSNIYEGGTSTIFRRGNRNVKVIYTCGESDYPSDVKEAILYLAAEQALGFIGARTGGGSISVQGFGRTFGERGKWQDIRNDLKRQAMFLLKSYMTGVVGGV